MPEAKEKKPLVPPALAPSPASTLASNQAPSSALTTASDLAPALAKPLPRNLQELPPASRQLCLKLRRFLREIAAQAPKASPFAGSPLLLAFSGGADSTALAVSLRCLGFDLVLAHLDHGLRPESGAEAAAARCFAQRLGVPSVVEKADVAGMAAARGLGLEEAGRIERYRFLQESQRLTGAGWIATGHHLDDLCEDMLLRLLRGTGWPGLGGMAAVDPQRRILRPLLSTPKEKLVAFLNELEIHWQEDASNQDARFTRNRVRQHLLPLVRAENPAFSRSALALWHMAREDEAYWAEQLKPVLLAMEERPYAACPGPDHTGPDHTGPERTGSKRSVPEFTDSEFTGPERSGPDHTAPEFTDSELTDSERSGSPREESGSEIFLPRQAFINLPRALRLRVYMALVHKASRLGFSGQARAESLFRLDAACQSGTARKDFPLPGGLLLVTDRAGLHLRRQTK